MFQSCSWRNVGFGSVMFGLVITTACESTIKSGGSGGAGGEEWTSASSSSSSSSSGIAGMGGSGGAGGSGGGMGGSGGSGGMLPACPSGSPAAFAVNKMFYGDTDPDGTANPSNGWKQFGFNIDGRISTKNSIDLCKPAAGGSAAAAYPDGNAGIDNSFGKNILPILLGLASDLTFVNNEDIAMGKYSYLLSLENADQDLCATQSALLLGGNLGMSPQFDGSDIWPIDASSLMDPLNPASAKCAFSNTRLEGGIVHAGPGSQFNLNLNTSGFVMVLPIHQVRMLYKLDADLKGATAGQIGGVIRTEDLVNEVAKVAAAFDASFCDPQSPTLISILNQLRQASDIMQDGTQNPAKECDGISIGLGFTLKSTQFGGVVPPVPPPADPCGP